MCTMHVNIIRSQCTRVPRSGEEANLSSPVSSHVHRESPSTLRRCTSPSLSLSLSPSALLPGSIGLLLMCLLTSVRRLGVADARNQSRPELGERERHKAPCCEARSFPRRSESGEKAMLFHSRLVCLSLSENDFRTRSDVSSRQPSHTTGRARAGAAGLSYPCEEGRRHLPSSCTSEYCFSARATATKPEMPDRQ